MIYTNQEINNKIVSQLIISNKTPTFITEDNFVFDKEIYDLDNISISKSSGGNNGRGGGGGGGGYGGGGGGGGGVGGGGGAWRILSKTNENNKIPQEILKKIDNLGYDPNYKKIYDKLYIRNYIGFENYEQMDILIKNMDNLRNNYKIRFPNSNSIGFTFSSFVLLAPIVFSIKRFRYVDSPGQKSNKCCVFWSKFMVFSISIIFFIGYYLYFIFTYLEFKKYKFNCSPLKKVKTEIFIEDIVKNVCNKINNKKRLLISEIILFSISFVIFISGWVLHFILSYLIKINKIQII